jgi:hypothetical protein
MIRIIFILMFLLFAAMAFCQDCPKDSTHSFYSKAEQMAYTYQLRHIKDVRGKCWEVERYFVHLPSGKELEISKEQYKAAEKKEGK